MPLPPVPEIVRKTADEGVMGKLLWVQPAVVRDGKMSERGDYFFERGMVVATGRLRLKAEPRKWRDVTDLNWDLYVNAWKHPETSEGRYQQIRVWYITFADGSTHICELPEAVSAGFPMGPSDASRAERAVWRAIVFTTQGDICRTLEDSQEPIVMGDQLVARHDGITVHGNDYKWSQVDGVWQFVDQKGFTLKREGQRVQVLVRIKIPGRPDPLAKVRAAYGASPVPGPTTYRDYIFEQDELDLPELFTLVREMPIHRKGFDEE